MHRLILVLTLILAAGCLPASRPGEASAEPAKATAPRFQGDVASFKITNDERAPVGERTVSFGQVFPSGRVHPDTRLAVRLDGTAVPAQLDAKAMYPDGTVRHGVLSILAPKMAGGASLEGVIASDGAIGPRPKPAPAPAPNLQVTVTMTSAEQNRAVSIDLTTLARAARPAPWLNGPLVQEQRYKAPMIDGVQVVFDVWTPATGPSRVDMIVHNDSAQNAQIGLRTYGLSAVLDGKEIFRAENLKHYRYQTWHHEIHTDGAQPPRITPDLKLLIATGAAPRYARLRPDAAQMNSLHKVAMQRGPPMGYVANLTPYMPTSGGRNDLGPLPAWAVFYLLDPSRKNRETLFANADVAGFIPWHVRDMRTDGPINIDDHPGVWLDYRGEATPDVLARKYETEDGVWAIDDAHQPSLSYLPYLLTGSQYYRDELAMQAGYNLLSINPEYRGQGRGIVVGLRVRSVAWDLRTLANAAYILPADDPLQAYFDAKLKANLQEIIRRYVEGDEIEAAGQLQGYLPGPYAVEGSVAPWQQDYLVIVLGWIDAMGYPQAKPILAWMTNFIAGRFTNADRGYDPIYGTPYYMYVADPGSQRPLDSWSAAFQATFDPVKTPVTMLDSPDWGGGYAALARASLASIVNATHSPQAMAAYDFVKAKTPEMEASYPAEPAFAIALDRGEQP